MKAKLTMAGVALGMFAVNASATELDINVSDKAARLTGMWSVDQRMRADVGWLHNTDRGNVAHAGIHLVDLATGGDHPIEAGLGGRIAWYDSDLRDQSGWAVPLGGFFRMAVPDADRVHVAGSAYYAPAVLSFDGGDGYYELNVNVGYEVLRQGTAYIGYRYVNGDFSRARSVSLDTGLHVGLRLTF